MNCSKLIEWSKPRYKLISKKLKNLMTCLKKNNLLFIVLGHYLGKSAIVDYLMVLDLSIDLNCRWKIQIPAGME